VLILYGGEPLLAMDLVREVVGDAPVSALILHTNGTLLDRLEPAVANRFDTVLVSIDGPEGLTDAHRGGGRLPGSPKPPWPYGRKVYRRGDRPDDGHRGYRYR